MSLSRSQAGERRRRQKIASAHRAKPLQLAERIAITQERVNDAAKLCLARWQDYPRLAYTCPEANVYFLALARELATLDELRRVPQ